MPVSYLTYKNIDKQKWNNCIDQAENGLVYANSAYLDTMAANWDGLVLDDYLAVMPLTWKNKYGIYYLYQPFATACLGLFGNQLTGGLLENFLTAIPGKFRYWDIYLNHGNLFAIGDFALYERMNYVLNLAQSHESIYAGYKENIRRNVKKAAQLNCICRKDIPVSNVIQIARTQSATYTHISEDDYERFEKLFALLHSRNQATTYGMYTPGGELVASCVLFYSHKRMYYILVGNSPNGKTIGASHALIDAIIKDHAGKDLILDFEGSDVPNLAFFYSSFGAVQEKYAGLKLNRLPKLIRWLKK